MTPSRRDFIERSATTYGALALGIPPVESTIDSTHDKKYSSNPLKILFIGGTGFIGPHMVRVARKEGHEVTLFNRGITNPHLFPDLEKLRGDRDGGLDILKGREWDAVIDTSGYLPRLVRDSAELLKDTVQQYLYISTTDAYQTYNIIDINEDAPMAILQDPTTEDVGSFYGPLKAQCEREVREVFPNRSTVIRPTWIVGPGDRRTDLVYWLQRINIGGEVLAPGDPTDPIQIIDARDLADFVIHLLENKTLGTYNAVGPESELSISEFLYGIRAITNSAINFTWVDAEFLSKKKIYPWRDLPLWWPPRDDYPGPPGMSIGGGTGFGLISRKLSISAGLRYRPLAVTAKDTLDWFFTWAEEWKDRQRSGLTMEIESEILAAWHAQHLKYDY
tara:strand:+ start:880 stop:2052 length:1173 start_codon:yes stop_codon:yes gene_type:complete